MNAVIHRSADRGHSDFGWLDSYHSFSFGQWHNPAQTHFGALRVINDDIVAGGGGFGTHPHDNMEIISIPLSGALTHKDSMGTNATISTGDVQIMSAGTGIRHSEYNASSKDSVNFLQIWVFPKLRNIKPHYDQKTFDPKDRQDRWQVVVSPDETEGGVSINQDARVLRSEISAGTSLPFSTKFKGSGIYVLVLEGSVAIGDKTLGRRDAIAIDGTDTINIQATEAASLLVLEVPMLA